MLRHILTIGVFTIVLALFGCQIEEIDSDPSAVSLNRIGMAGTDSNAYRFLVIGHTYGGIQIDDRLPGQNLLRSVDDLKSMELRFLVSLGDMVMHSTLEEYESLDRSLLSVLPFPIFNAPGNHDVEDRTLYESRFGRTYYTFRYGPARFIFLDTEYKTCQINTSQQELLGKALKAGLRDRDTMHIFIFMHKTLFLHNDFLYERQKHWAMPNVWECYNNTNFIRIMDEKILPVAAKKPVYLFAGDVGAWGNLSPYYEHREDVELTMIMTGLGDESGDSGILVTINGKEIDLEAYSFTGQNMPSLESFTPAFWNQSAMQEKPLP